MNKGIVVNQVISVGGKRQFKYEIVCLVHENEVVIAQFAYPGDAHRCAQALADQPHPPGEWKYIVRNVKPARKAVVSR